MSGEPIDVWNFERKFCFGAIRIWHLTEDRRPDLAERSVDAKELGYKYKHQLKVRVLFFTYSVITHSHTLGTVFVNDRDVQDGQIIPWSPERVRFERQKYNPLIWLKVRLEELNDRWVTPLLNRGK